VGTLLVMTQRVKPGERGHTPSRGAPCQYLTDGGSVGEAEMCPNGGVGGFCHYCLTRTVRDRQQRVSTATNVMISWSSINNSKFFPSLPPELPSPVTAASPEPFATDDNACQLRQKRDDLLDHQSTI
jgi:hypothetical protein